MQVRFLPVQLNFAESRGLSQPSKTMSLLKDLDDIINQTHTSDHAATRARLGGFKQKLEGFLADLRESEEPTIPTESIQPPQPIPEANAEGSGEPPAKLV